MASEIPERIFDWVAVLAPVGAVALLVWSVVGERCAPDPTTPDVAAPGAQIEHETERGGLRP